MKRVMCCLFLLAGMTSAQGGKLAPYRSVIVETFTVEKNSETTDFPETYVGVL